MSFFSRQFSLYLLGKNHLFCSLSEGDMIHDMLRMEDRFSKISKTVNCRFIRSILTGGFRSEFDFP